MTRSGISGVNKLRRTLRRVEPSITQEVREAVERTAEAIQLDAVDLAPRDEGDLVRAIQKKVGRDGMTAVVGPGAAAALFAERRVGSAFGATNLRLSERNKDLLFQFFKGHWIEFGTKATSGPHPQPARPFMQPAFDMNKDWGKAQVRSAVNNALRRASRGD